MGRAQEAGASILFFVTVTTLSMFRGCNEGPSDCMLCASSRAHVAYRLLI